MPYENGYDDCKCHKKCPCPESCPTGPQGPQGSAGPRGPQGIAGQTGLEGPQGPEGAQGPQGVQGQPGNCVECPGQPGPKGDAGPAGPMGPAGQNGVDGLPGAMGPAGPMGPAGADGAMGPAGPKGDQGDAGTFPENLKPEYAEVYSTTAQTLAMSPGANLMGGVVVLENTVKATANIDVSQASVNGKITVNRAGWYDVYTGMCGTLNPIPSPLPVWTLSLFRNGILVPGSTFANMPLSPEQGSNEVVADVFVHFDAGDVLELANTSTAPVFLTAPTVGTNAQTNSSYLKIILLEGD